MKKNDFEIELNDLIKQINDTIYKINLIENFDNIESTEDIINHITTLKKLLYDLSSDIEDICICKELEKLTDEDLKIVKRITV